jgi:cytochrome c-type biogenesis protein CcmH
MIIFVSVAAAMLLVALAGLAWPMLKKSASEAVDRNRQNLDIARERLAELEVEKRADEISDEEFQQVKTEVEKTLADELQEEPLERRAGSTAGALGVAAIGVLLPLLTLAFYLAIGSPQLINGATAQQQDPAPHGEAPGQQSVEQLVQKLAERLQQQPENAEGWFLLGRSYMNLGRYAEAVEAFNRVDELQPDTPAVLLALANAAAMAQGGRIGGRPEELVNRVLAQDGANTVALWLAGIAAEERGEFTKALEYWKRAEPNLEGADREELRSRMLAVARQADISIDFGDARGESRAAVKVRVSLDPELTAKLSGEETVFIFAKALNGPPMPLAASRHKVRELPLEVTLDDSMAMTPQAKLSSAAQVTISAKISAGGSATPMEGDLVSNSVTVSPSASEPVSLLISGGR